MIKRNKLENFIILSMERKSGQIQERISRRRPVLSSYYTCIPNMSILACMVVELFLTQEFPRRLCHAREGPCINDMYVLIIAIVIGNEIMDAQTHGKTHGKLELYNRPCKKCKVRFLFPAHPPKMSCICTKPTAITFIGLKVPVRVVATYKGA